LALGGGAVEYMRGEPIVFGLAGDPPIAPTYAPGEAQVLKPGELYIEDWSGYPAGQHGLTQPKGPFRLLTGTEYTEARAAANATNAAIRRQLPLWRSAGLEWHEITPVKFGGSPTDLANKIPLPLDFHKSVVTPWWKTLQRGIEGVQ
jgi:hypothetical protein